MAIADRHQMEDTKQIWIRPTEWTNIHSDSGDTAIHNHCERFLHDAQDPEHGCLFGGEGIRARQVRRSR